MPSTTETVFALGGGDRVVGVTRFCVHPSDARQRARVVGGTKNPNVERILELEPDLVLANQEENRREDVDTLSVHVPVHVSFPRSVSDAVRDIRSLGEILGEIEAGEGLASEIEARQAELESSQPPFRYLYLIWRRPYMVVGPGTFVEALLGEAGGINVAPTDRGRYPEVTDAEMEAAGADVVLLSSEPFPFREEHRVELSNSLRRFPPERVLLVDGELLSWHGVRLRMGLPYLQSLAARVSSC